MKERNLDLVQELLELEVDPSPRMRRDGWTPLHTAANRRQNLEMIQLLVQYRADVNAVYVLHPKIVSVYHVVGPSMQSFYLSGLLVLGGPLSTGQSWRRTQHRSVQIPFKVLIEISLISPG